MAEPPFRLLVVCTANICRSVMAERFLRRDAAERGLAIEVASCGLLFDGEPASDKVVAIMAERDIDVTDHVSRRATAELLAPHDLVVTMERSQARELAVIADGVSTKVHTLGALTAWLDGPHDEPLPGSPPARVAAFAKGRKARDLLGAGGDEVPDPHGRSKRRHRRTADRLEVLCAKLLDGLYGAAETGPSQTEAGTAE